MLSVLSVIFLMLVSWLNWNFPANSLISPTAEVQAQVVASPVIERPGHCQLQAKSGLAQDVASRYELCSQEPDLVLPIASISKLVSALVFLDHNPGWEIVYRLKTEDRREGGRIYLFSGDEVKAKDLFYNALVASDNTAVIALVNLTGLSEEDFVKEMNNKVRSLGLINTTFVEPTGLSSQNQSTAREVAVFGQVALNQPDIRAAVINTEHHFTTEQGRAVTVYSTGQPLASQLQGFTYLGGKTGYLVDSGYCFVGLFAKGEQQVVTVILGADSQGARFSQTAELLSALPTTSQLN